MAVAHGGMSDAADPRRIVEAGYDLVADRYAASRPKEASGRGVEVLETSIESQLEGSREVSFLWVLAQFGGSASSVMG